MKKKLEIYIADLEDKLDQSQKWLNRKKSPKLKKETIDRFTGRIWTLETTIKELKAIVKK